MRSVSARIRSGAIGDCVCTPDPPPAPVRAIDPVRAFDVAPLAPPPAPVAVPIMPTLAPPPAPVVSPPPLSQRTYASIFRSAQPIAAVDETVLAHPAAIPSISDVSKLVSRSLASLGVDARQTLAPDPAAAPKQSRLSSSVSSSDATPAPAPADASAPAESPDEPPDLSAFDAASQLSDDMPAPRARASSTSASTSAASSSAITAPGPVSALLNPLHWSRPAQVVGGTIAAALALYVAVKVVSK